MNQEEKELLFKDLCGRLPYHPIVYVDENLPRLKLGVATRVWEYIAVDKPCKPYLRSMSSMTDEEKLALSLCDAFIEPRSIELKVDLYNNQHLDYRGLIEKGLALKAPEGMYNIKE